MIEAEPVDIGIIKATYPLDPGYANIVYKTVQNKFYFDVFF